MGICSGVWMANQHVHTGNSYTSLHVQPRHTHACMQASDDASAVLRGRMHSTSWPGLARSPPPPRLSQLALGANFTCCALQTSSQSHMKVVYTDSMPVHFSGHQLGSGMQGLRPYIFTLYLNDQSRHSNQGIPSYEHLCPQPNSPCQQPQPAWHGMLVCELSCLMHAMSWQIMVRG